jgi:nicotinamide mononucleotide transporter
MVNVALYSWIFFESRLFASASLQLFFLVLAAWGWWQWLHGEDEGKPLRVRRAPRRLLILLGVAVLLLTPWVATLLVKQGGAFPTADAFLAMGSLAAQFLQARKYLECWATWIGVDLGYVAFYAVAGLPLTSVLYLAWTGLAVAGLLAWHHSQGQEASATS